MASPTRPSRAHRERLIRLLARGPKRPSELGGRSWWGVFQRTVGEFMDDDLTDKAAALTYYGILSIFPGLLVLLASIGLLGRRTTEDVVANLRELTPGPARDIIANGIENLQQNQGAAGVAAIIGLAAAFWSANAYIGAFMRAANQIYDVPEGRPLWKKVPVRFLMTIIMGVFLAVSALAVLFSGRLAAVAGRALGIEEAAVRTFDIAKWPVLVLAIALLLAMLYWAAPNARQGGFRWITPGSLLAVVVWVAVSAGFAVYLAFFDSYNKTYGTLGGVIIFLVWLWLTNVAVLLGAEFDAELSRGRAIAAGLPRDAEPYLPLRDVPSGTDQPDQAEPPDDHGEPDRTRDREPTDDGEPQPAEVDERQPTEAGDR
jgi:membrane protein